MKLSILLAASLTLTGLGIFWLSTDLRENTARKAFIDFKTKYNKSYGSKSELEYRFEVFRKALELIEKVNSDPSKSFELGVNKFADLTFEEFSNQYLNFSFPSSSHQQVSENTTSTIAKKSVDWRKTPGAVGPIKDQAACGSCWAFSAVCALEFHYFMKTGKSLSFSEQELVDCSPEENTTYGCRGGLMSGAFDYIIKNSVDTEQNYPYTGDDDKCVADKSSPERYTITSYSQLSGPDVSDLVKAIDKQVVAVAIQVDLIFMYYKSGIYHQYEEECGEQRNHALAAVGYDSTGDDPFFIVRNSWTTDWGEQGYIRMAFGTGRGTCGIVGPWDVTPDL